MIWARNDDESVRRRVETWEGGYFAFTAPDGSFTLQIFAGRLECKVGWYGPRGIITVKENATLIEVDGESVVDIVVQLPGHPDAFPCV